MCFTLASHSDTLTMGLKHPAVSYIVQRLSATWRVAVAWCHDHVNYWELQSVAPTWKWSEIVLQSV